MKTKWNLDDLTEAQTLLAQADAGAGVDARLFDYAHLKTQSHAARLAGHIQEALALERRMDAIYSRLPDHLKTW